MFISPFITSRITAQMQELTLGQTMELCEIPDEMNEYGIGKMLSFVVTETNLPVEEWTAQERLFALSHYLVALNKGDVELEDENGNIIPLSEYMIDKDYPESNYTFKQFDKEEEITLEVVPLTGEYLEAVERACIANGKKMGDWVVATMAAQIRVAGEMWNGVADDYVQENIKRLKELPLADFDSLFFEFCKGLEQQEHLLRIGFSNDGLMLKGGAGLPPVRFPFITAISETATLLWK